MSTRADAPRATLTTDGAEGGPTRSMLGTLRVLGTLVAPTTLIVALLYYFGWARTDQQAARMGLHESLFGFSAQDYILRSIGSLFLPLFVAAGVILLGVLAHGRLLERPALRRRLTGPLVLAGAILLVVGLALSPMETASAILYVGSPLSVTVGVALLAYAATLVPPSGAERRRRSDRSAARLAWSLVTVLLLLGAFWTVSRYATVKGRALARTVEEDLDKTPSVTIYSVSRLYLEDPVVEQALPAEEGAYRYRYTGLRLLFRADGKLFLRPSETSDKRNIVIPEDLDIRVEYG
ncbi:MAG TPA: hypothetical protein VFA00_00580 [Actinomycetota bacterium]|jgi:hypothetical protein|nr:hypothetical protein [Actinomycetota bacterium]